MNFSEFLKSNFEVESVTFENCSFEVIDFKNAREEEEEEEERWISKMFSL